MAIAFSSIYPATAPVTGGTVHYIVGTDLTTVTGVTIGGTAVTSFEALNSSLMKVVVPAGAAGAANVVLNPGAVTGTGALTYTAVGTEQLVSTLARKWKLDVNTGSVGAPAWTAVRAIGEFKPTQDNNMEDDSDYESDGFASETKTQIKWGGEVKALRKVGVESTNYDPGQEALRTAADKFGSAGTREIRYYDRDGGPEAFQGFVSVAWEPEGGDAKDLDTVTIKLSGNGVRREITNPAA